MSVQGFTVPGRLPGRNEVDYMNRSGWKKGNDLVQSEEDRIMWAIREAGVKPVDYPVEVIVDFYEKKAPKGKRRDVDNVKGGGNKLILDALKKLGIIADDDPCHMRNIYGWVGYEQPNPRVEVKIVPYDPNGRVLRYPPVEGVD